MRHKKTLILLSVVTLMILGVSFYLGDPVHNNLCRLHDVTCNSLYSEAIAQPMFFFSLAFLIICFVLFFVREEVYKSWRRFAIWAIPIGIIILWIAPTSTPGTWLGGGDFTKETASWGVSILFLAISLFIIISHSLRSETPK